ncbi:MAG: hypothetical protein CSA22_04810 [Deltaproteobacteria bacterium]|nr:MAG: hypothetical protein CSA22_04810 [Deltaproteobacteria bacterium]
MNPNSKYHVVSGAYHIATRRDITLEAFLGTCVGVAISDPVNGVGGLIHLLLPEPVSQTSIDTPEKYASTGLPIFIQALLDSGAETKNMTATVAGGALIRPISRQDIYLNIGGRTAEVALNLLQSVGIHVETAETGGFTTSCLELDLSTFDTRILPSFDETETRSLSFTPPTADEIRTAVERLSPIPQSVLCIMNMLDEDRFNFTEIADEARKDQVITAKTLHLCNTAIFSCRRRIDSLDDALILLGQDAFYKLIISAFINRFFEQSDAGYSLCKGGLYHHAIGTALIAEKLSEFTQTISPATAYTAGLIHNIGMVVLDQYMANAFPLFYRGLQKKDSNILSVEKEILGVHHCEVGAMLCSLWGFPDNLTRVIACHHTPDAAPSHTDLISIVSISDFLMTQFHTVQELSPLSLGDLEHQLSYIGFSLDRLVELIDMIPIQFFGNTQREPVRLA